MQSGGRFSRGVTVEVEVEDGNGSITKSTVTIPRKIEETTKLHNEIMKLSGKRQSFQLRGRSYRVLG